MRVRRSLGSSALLACCCGAFACNTASPTPIATPLVLLMPDPIVARYVPGTSTMVAEFPVTISDPTGAGGTLGTISATVFNRSRGTIIVRNERPNESYSFPRVNVPAGGALTVDAGAGFPMPPPRDDIVVIVEARLTNGRQVSGTAGLRQEF